MGEAAHADGARRAIARLRPDVALIDSELPPKGGIQLCAEVKDADVPTRVLIMCIGNEYRTMSSALEAGAQGCVSHEGGLDEIADACRAMARDELFVPPRLLAPLLKGLILRRREEDDVARRAARLTRREKEVFALLVDGHDHEKIAEALVISRATARTHVQNVLRKLEVHSRLEATALAIHHDLVSALSLTEAI
jgi:DNA-binding NarL/FixJ family response regulator